MAMSLHGLGPSVAVYSRLTLTGLLPESPRTKSRSPAWIYVYFGPSNGRVKLRMARGRHHRARLVGYLGGK